MPHSGTVYDEYMNIFVIAYKKLTNKGKYCDKFYGYVMLNDEEGVRRGVFLHVLKANTFIQNPENKEFIDHLDNDILNNDITNLRWRTMYENGRHRGVQRNNKSTGIKTSDNIKNGTFRVRFVDYDGVRHDKTVKNLSHLALMVILYLDSKQQVIGICFICSCVSTAVFCLKFPISGYLHLRISLII